jgi:hypothetical protein
MKSMVKSALKHTRPGAAFNTSRICELNRQYHSSEIFCKMSIHTRSTDPGQWGNLVYAGHCRTNQSSR